MQEIYCGACNVTSRVEGEAATIDISRPSIVECPCCHRKGATKVIDPVTMRPKIARYQKNRMCMQCKCREFIMDNSAQMAVCAKCGICAAMQ